MKNASREKLIFDLKEKNIQFDIDNIDEFKNRATPMTFICKKCGRKFKASPHNIIINKQGCPICGKKHRWTFDEIKNTVENLYNKEYLLLSTEEEIRKKTGKISTNYFATFKHKKCGKIFKRKITRFIHEGLACSFCISNKKKTNKEIQEKLDKIYYGQFKLISNYDGRRKKIKVLCNVCKNITEDYAYNFLTNKRKCLFCCASTKEQYFINYFKELDYQKNKTFKNLIYKEHLFYDFLYKNLLIEIDGEQHFSKNNYFGDFEIRNKRDCIKNKFVLNNNLSLLRILDKDVDEEILKSIKENSETIQNINFSNKSVLLIKDKKIIKRTGKYNNIQIGVDSSESKKELK